MKRVTPAGTCEVFVEVGVRCPRPATNSRDGFAMCRPHALRQEGFLTSELVKRERTASPEFRRQG